jgi:DNA mismatch repair protein MutH
MMGLTKMQKQNFLNIMSNYYGVNQSKLILKLDIEIKNGLPKNIRNIIAQSILKNYEKKEKVSFQNILLKTIRINENNTLLESMSFTQIKYNEIIKESWENSDLYKTLSSEFIFLIFKVKNKDDNDPIFQSAKFWKMSEADLDLVNKFWELTKESIRIGDYKNFITIKNNFICHVRTKGLNNKDLMKTPQGTIEPKRGYWLNASYLKTQLF